MSQGKVNFPIPSRNVFWETVRGENKPEIEERRVGSNSLFIYYRGGLPDAVIAWGGQDVREAQAWLTRHAFHRCSKPDCGIRLGSGKKLGNDCGNRR